MRRSDTDVRTVALSVLFDSWPIHKKHSRGVTRTKQSPLFSERASGSAKRTCTFLQPDKKTKEAKARFSQQLPTDHRILYMVDFCRNL